MNRRTLFLLCLPVFLAVTIGGSWTVISWNVYRERSSARYKPIYAAQERYNAATAKQVGLLMMKPPLPDDHAERTGFANDEVSAASIAIRQAQAVREPVFSLAPFAVCFIASLLPAMVYFVRKRLLARQRRERLLLNLCVHCGYDSRANPTRCPECGNDPKRSEDREIFEAIRL